MKMVDNGPWSAGKNQSDNRFFVESDDFKHDVRLYIDGDFGSETEKMEYAVGIANLLNIARYSSVFEERDESSGLPTNSQIMEIAHYESNANLTRHLPEEFLVRFARHILRKFTKTQQPSINVIAETKTETMIGFTGVPVDRIECEDDGTYTVIVNTKGSSL